MPTGNCNSTGGVDLLDHSHFEPCLLGPDAGVAEGCECFDVNRSGTVDLLDVALAQAGFTRSLARSSSATGRWIGRDLLRFDGANEILPSSSFS